MAKQNMESKRDSKKQKGESRREFKETKRDSGESKNDFKETKKDSWESKMDSRESKKASKKDSKSPAKTLSAQIKKSIKYEFENENLLLEALTHKSAGAKNNERLEFLGDAVVDLLVGEYLFRAHPNASEGALSKARANLVSEDGLSFLAQKIGIDSLLLMSQSESKSAGRKKPSILADAFEALVAAIYLDGGLESARAVVENLLKAAYAGQNLIKIITDYKTELQEITQERFGEIPRYELVGESGPDHARVFLAAVFLGGVERARASGKSKKAAQQNCAKELYLELADARALNGADSKKGGGKK